MSSSLHTHSGNRRSLRLASDECGCVADRMSIYVQAGLLVRRCPDRAVYEPAGLFAGVPTCALTYVIAGQVPDWVGYHHVGLHAGVLRGVTTRAPRNQQAGLGVHLRTSQPAHRYGSRPTHPSPSAYADRYAGPSVHRHASLHADESACPSPSQRKVRPANPPAMRHADWRADLPARLHAELWIGERSSRRTSQPGCPTGSRQGSRFVGLLGNLYASGRAHGQADTTGGKSAYEYGGQPARTPEHRPTRQPFDRQATLTACPYAGRQVNFRVSGSGHPVTGRSGYPTVDRFPTRCSNRPAGGTAHAAARMNAPRQPRSH